MNYRCYKKFDTHKFENDLLIPIKDSENLKHFCDKFQSVFNLHAPIKKKKIRHNNQPFMTKALRKAIMVRSKLRNIFNKYINITPINLLTIGVSTNDKETSVLTYCAKTKGIILTI